MFLIEVSLINRILFHSLYVKHLTGFTYLLVLTEPENILVKYCVHEQGRIQKKPPWDPITYWIISSKSKQIILVRLGFGQY